jgi:hypothetical protein
LGDDVRRDPDARIDELAHRNRLREAGVYTHVRTAFRLPVLLLILTTIACSPTVDLTRGLRIESIATGWYEASAAEGHIKLVPAVSFRLANVSNRTLRTLQVNAIFKRVTEDTEWGSGFRTVAGSTGLLPTNTSDSLFLRSELGYVGTESRLDLLKNSRFVDARVDIYAKYEATTWAPIGHFAIARILIEP